ncbi:MAG: flippase-like domain-containing protein [Candidatus Saccharimonas sp.]|nr:flippase-like domain-containing protein [Candidatus Saccharimonas sp.]
MRLSFKSILSIVTLALVVLVLVFSRHQLEHAWGLMSQVNIWLLASVAVFTILSYLFSGEMIFSYLRQKNIIREVSPLTLMRVSLELNFVNHILPSGGVSGVSYMNWRLGKFGVSAAQAMMAQAVRYAAGFASTIVLLIVSLVIVTIDGNINRWIILMSAFLVITMTVTVAVFVYIVKSPTRIQRFGDRLQQLSNRIVRVVTRGRRRKIIDTNRLVTFFDDMHRDYVQLSRDKSLLVQPFIWGTLFVICDILIFFVTFLALGEVVNPAGILIAYSLASLAGFAIVTPGGAGAYEAIMVWVLAVAGVQDGKAIAGVVLARVIILLITIGVGYIFYQLTLNKYGKRTADIQSK